MYPLPPLGAPVRVAFLGPAATTAAHALHDPAGGLLPRFVDVRPGADPRAALEESHVVIALGAFAMPSDTPAATLAVIGAHDDIPAGYDRVLRLPGGDDACWRSRPLPVDDRLFAPVTQARSTARALCVGRSTEHREWVLTPAKHAYDVVHYAHGLVGPALAGVLAQADVGIALHADPGPGFPAQALVHLAAGHLLLAERLTPPCGLEPGIDFLEIASREDLLTLLHQLRLRPDAYERIRIRGRQKAESHRASRVWPRIVGDLLQDLRVFGGARTLHA